MGVTKCPTQACTIPAIVAKNHFMVQIYSEQHYCLLICYWLVCTIFAADDKGHHFGHHCCRRMSSNSIKHIGQHTKLISTLIYWIYWITSTAESKLTCARSPTPKAAWVHQIHAPGGASGSNTMVMVFVTWFVLFVWFLTHDSSVVLVIRTIRGVTKWATQACTIPLQKSGAAGYH